MEARTPVTTTTTTLQGDSYPEAELSLPQSPSGSSQVTANEVSMKIIQTSFNWTWRESRRDGDGKITLRARTCADLKNLYSNIKVLFPMPSGKNYSQMTFGAEQNTFTERDPCSDFCGTHYTHIQYNYKFENDAEFQPCDPIEQDFNHLPEMAEKIFAVISKLGSFIQFLPIEEYGLEGHSGTVIKIVACVPGIKLSEFVTPKTCAQIAKELSTPVENLPFMPLPIAEVSLPINQRQTIIIDADHKTKYFAIYAINEIIKTGMNCQAFAERLRQAQQATSISEAAQYL